MKLGANFDANLFFLREKMWQSCNGLWVLHEKICKQITILLTAPLCNVPVLFFGCIDKTEFSGKDWER